MKSHLVLALALAAFILVVLGERIGFGPAGARLAIVGILAQTIIAQALISATSRLPDFLDGARDNAFLKSLGGQLVLILAALWTAGIAAGQPGDLGLFFAGYAATLLLLPRAALASLAEPSGAAGDVGGTRLALRFAGAVAALVLASMLFPRLEAMMPLVPGLPAGAARWLAAGALALPLLLGGLKAAGRLAAQLVLLVAVIVLLPFAVEIAGAMLASGQDLARWAEQLAGLAERGASARPAGMALAEARPAAFGVAAALIAGASQAHLPGRAPRFLAAWLAAVLAIALLLAALIGKDYLMSIVASEIAGVVPGRWPVFAFDEAIRGWISVCGGRPGDTLEVAQACRLAGVPPPPPAAAISLDAQLMPEALALARGWPATLGVLWRLAEPLIAFAALGLMIHAAASACSEIVLYRMVRPRSLRSGRLALVRLSLLMMLVLVALAGSAGWPLETRLIDALILGSAFSVGLILLAAGLAACLRGLSHRTGVARGSSRPGPSRDLRQTSAGSVLS